MNSNTVSDRSLLESVRADDAVAMSLAEAADGVVTVTFSLFGGKPRTLSEGWVSG